MKKYLSLILGFTFVAGGIFVSFSEASRDAYHVYLMTQKNQKRDILFRAGRSKSSEIKRSQNIKLFDLKHGENPYFKARNYKRTRRSLVGVKAPRLKFPQNKFTFKSLRGVEKRNFKFRNFKNSRKKITKFQEPQFEKLKLRTVSKNYRGIRDQKTAQVKNNFYKKARNFRNTRLR